MISTDITLAPLMANFAGEIIQPGDASYDEARRIWNGVHDKYPALIVRPRSAADVVAAVTFAREQNLLIAVRGGGHNVAGLAMNDGGIVIDLSAMKGITIDPQRRIARAEGGVTWGELDAATQVYGLATPGGVFSKTGIAGLTLGGGFGWLRNTYGLSCDNLLAADVVTADGRLIRASADEYPDLLWGLRGGGGNFGIVTAFEFQLHPVGPEVMMAFVLHDTPTPERMRDAVRFFRDYTASAPEEVSMLMALGQIPPSEHFPKELHGRSFALFAGLFASNVEQGKEVLQPVLDFGKPLVDMSGVKPYIEAQQMFDADYPDGLRYYWKSLNLMQLDDESIAMIVEHARRQPSPYSTTDLWHIGGAVKRFGSETSAFHGRHATYLLNPEANWIDEADDGANIEWVRQFVGVMEPFSDGSRYLNFAGFQEEGDQMMRESFGAQYQRLADLKRIYDPENLFRLNQNIKPE